MSFANPTALFWAALALPVIVFYILKIRLRRVPVSTVLFWQQIFEEKKPRSLWERLRHLVSLLIQLVLLVLLVGALAEPFFAGELMEARRLVLVIDNSASMNATDVSPSRLAQAKESGHRIIAGMRHRDEMAIVVAGTQPRVVCGLTGHQRSLREALDSVLSTDGPTVLKEAITLARQLVDESHARGGKTGVIVLSDGCTEGAASLFEDEKVRLVTFGNRTGNVGITRFQVRRSPLEPVGYEILAEVVNHSDEPVECRFELTLEGVDGRGETVRDLIDVVPLKLDPNGKWTQTMEKVSAAGGTLTAQLMSSGDAKQPHADALAADNKAVALLPRRDEQPVCLISPETNLFLQKVLEVSPLVKLQIDKKLPTGLRSGTVQVFHRVAPNPLPAGAVMVVDPATDTDLWSVGDKLLNPIVTQQQKDSALMAHLRLDNVLMPEAKKLTWKAAAGKPEVLAGSVTGEPLYALIDRPTGKVLVLTVNLDQGELPFRTAFPILVSNALNFFAGNAGELHEALATGSITEVELPADGATFMARSPTGQLRKLPEGVARTTIGPFDECGIWSIVRSGNAPEQVLQQVACNLASKTESDLRPPEGLPESASLEHAGAMGSITGRPVWFYLIAAAFLLAGLEWYLYQRRWIS